MCRIRPDVMQLCPPLVIEAMHQFGVAPQCFGRAHILDAMPFPKPIRPAKGGESADRKSVVSGRSVEVRVDLGGRRISRRKIKTKIESAKAARLKRDDTN